MQVASELELRQVGPQPLEHVDSRRLAAQVDEVAAVRRRLEGIGSAVQQHFNGIKRWSPEDCELNEREVAYFLLNREAIEDEFVQSILVASDYGFFYVWQCPLDRAGRGFLQLLALLASCHWVICCL